MSSDLKVGLLWREEWDNPDPSGRLTETCKLRDVFAAFADLGVNAQPVVYSDSAVETVREQLLGLDGVLVWVNPIQNGLDRSRLDPLLREVADEGVFVSAHPDVVLRMGTKEVLIETASLSWGSDTRVYRSAAEFRDRLPRRLREVETPLVLKQHRGMGGTGVWKVTMAGPDSVIVQHASGGATPERESVDEFLRRCDPYFTGAGLMVEQPYQERLPEGMIRAYLTHDRVVGFAHQYPRGLMPPGQDDRPTSKNFEPPSAPAYESLRARLETEWVPAMQATLGLDTEVLPVIWDADFLYGPQDDAGADTFVLCEINVSSTFAFPEFAIRNVAHATVERMKTKARTRPPRASMAAG
jgi:hypothetical protein